MTSGSEHDVFVSIGTRERTSFQSFGENSEDMELSMQQTKDLTTVAYIICERFAP